MESRHEQRYGDGTAPKRQSLPEVTHSEGVRIVAVLRFTRRLGPGVVPGVIIEPGDNDLGRAHLRPMGEVDQGKPTKG